MSIKVMIDELLAIEGFELNYDRTTCNHEYNEYLQKICNEFFIIHNQIKDLDYKEFMNFCGGAILDSILPSNDVNYFFISIYEIDGVLQDFSIDNRDKSSFFTFAEASFRFKEDANNFDDGIVTYTYAFDESDNNSGVYKAIYIKDRLIKEYFNFYPSFSIFLKDIVTKKGLLLNSEEIRELNLV
jgi:hypothetical protein